MIGTGIFKPPWQVIQGLAPIFAWNGRITRVAEPQDGLKGDSKAFLQGPFLSCSAASQRWLLPRACLTAHFVSNEIRRPIDTANIQAPK